MCEVGSLASDELRVCNLSVPTGLLGSRPSFDGTRRCQNNQVWTPTSAPVAVDDNRDQGRGHSS